MSLSIVHQSQKRHKLVTEFKETGNFKESCETRALGLHFRNMRSRDFFKWVSVIPGLLKWMKMHRQFI